MKKLLVGGILVFFLSCLSFPAGAEDSLLPEFLARAGEETGRRCVMFVFGHFDDDSLITGTISLFLRSGWEVHEVWITSAGLGKGSIWGAVKERREEAERAAAIVGVPPENRHVLGVADREAVYHLPEICDRITELVNTYKPSLLITCAYEGGHWDHDASCLAAYVASLRVGFPVFRFEFPTYNASGPRIMPFRLNAFIKAYGPPRYVPLDREAWRVRRKVRYAYQSQWFLMLPEGLIFGYRRLLGRGEPIRETPDYDFTRPPHPGTLLVQHPAFGALRNEPFSTWEKHIRLIPEFRQKDES